MIKTKSEEEEESKRVDEAIHVLGQYFDSVHIFCTRSNGDEATTYYCKSTGNVYAGYGLVHEWLEKQKERARVAARVSEEASPSDTENLDDSPA